MKIKKDVIKLALEIAKESYPNEFIALLTGEGDVIDELIFLPFQSSEYSAVINLDALPLGYKVYGTVHSHPSPSCEPSDEDLYLFLKYGGIHIIVCYPFDENSWKCYDSHGNEVKIEVIN